jgi:protein-S-isoprenylcysteine O-methyltransferase Ste14
VFYLLRHLFAVLALPTIVTVVVPLWIAGRFGVAATWPDTAMEAVLVPLGIVIFLAGLVLFTASVHHFFVYGRGTLAPWDPPRHFVVNGPYRYVRNPMISGVGLILVGIALVLRSIPHGVWALTFFVINAIYIPVSEEPGLERRFGADYTTYKRHVHRFMPRLRPWSAEGGELRASAASEPRERSGARGPRERA